MWAAKPHYYGSTFYNWPYTFGLLFGLGLYARWQDDPAGFRAGYDDLLSSTGLGTAAELAARFGIDVARRGVLDRQPRRPRARIDDFDLRSLRALHRQSIARPREDVGAVVGDEQGVLELGGAAAVDGDRRPAVVPQLVLPGARSVIIGSMVKVMPGSMTVVARGS